MRSQSPPTLNNVVDTHIGQSMRARRLALGWTQSDLGDKIELTAQQVSKYERGATISARRLYQIAITMEMSPGAFFPRRPAAPSSP
jgi:transcriptional regulator with XRE-family HTH domain